MKPETDPITDDEWLLRRIHTDHIHEGRIAERAFRPRLSGRDPDTNGISLYRLTCLQNPAEILATIPEERRPLSGIVHIPVKLILDLGMTVKIEPDSRVLGHVVIPEMNADGYISNAEQVGEWISKLTLIASEPANILLRPTPQAP